MSKATLAIIKPDAVGKGQTGKIIDGILSSGFTLMALKMVHLTEDEARRFYEVHREKEFFDSLVRFMTSGPSIPMVVKKDDAVRELRSLLGATDPQKAESGTLRHRYGSSVQENAIHGSDSDETALKEIAFFFPTVEIPG